MSEVISPFQMSSVRVSIALNVVLILTIILPLLPIATNAAHTRYCVLTSQPVAAPDLAQSGKIRPNTVSPVVKLPVSNVRRSNLAKSAHLAEMKVNFVRCVPPEVSLGG